jgi:hypothetical protein
LDGTFVLDLHTWEALEEFGHELKYITYK